MPRSFSTTTQKLFKLIWKGTSPDPGFTGILEDVVKDWPKLKNAKEGHVHGNPHAITDKFHASVVFKGSEGKSLISGHVYPDGDVRWSRQSWRRDWALFRGVPFEEDEEEGKKDVKKGKKKKG